MPLRLRSLLTRSDGGFDDLLRSFVPKVVLVISNES